MPEKGNTILPTGVVGHQLLLLPTRPFQMPLNGRLINFN
jgi:hypothetical protein